MSAIFVPVVDQEHTPLMPTIPARARRWIRSGKATHFWKGGVFCVRLNVEPSRRVQQPHASHPPQAQDTMPAAAPEPQAEQEEAAAFHQSPLALETAPGEGAVPALPGERLRGRRHQGHDPWQEALESVLFPVRSGQALVLWRTLEAGSCPDQTGLRDKSTARAGGTQENEQEVGRGLGSALYRCLGTRLQRCGRADEAR